MPTKIASILVVLMSVLWLTAGCSRISGPSDEQVITAIKKTGTAGDRNFGVKMIDVVILERGNKLENGDIYPIKAKCTQEVYNPGSPMTVQKVELTVYLVRQQDDMGKYIWVANRWL